MNKWAQQTKHKQGNVNKLETSQDASDVQYGAFYAGPNCTWSGQSFNGGDETKASHARIKCLIWTFSIASNCGISV